MILSVFASVKTIIIIIIIIMGFVQRPSFTHSENLAERFTITLTTVAHKTTKVP